MLENIIQSILRFGTRAWLKLLFITEVKKLVYGTL
jgi:hypothetical protein